MSFSEDTDAPWRVGVLFSQTGVTSAIEQSQLNATLLAIQEINSSGGVLDRMVEPVIYDPASDPKQFRALAERLDDADLAIIDKRRPRPNESKVMNIIGEVEGRTCVLIDDMVDTAGTLCQAAQALKDEGAVKVVAYITHPVLSGAAIERISKSVLDELVVTDTIPLSEEGRACTRIRQLSVAGLLAETVRRINDEESVSSLYID